MVNFSICHPPARCSSIMPHHQRVSSILLLLNSSSNCVSYSLSLSSPIGPMCVRGHTSCRSCSGGSVVDPDPQRSTDPPTMIRSRDIDAYHAFYLCVSISSSTTSSLLSERPRLVPLIEFYSESRDLSFDFDHHSLLRLFHHNADAFHSLFYICHCSCMRAG